MAVPDRNHSGDAEKTARRGSFKVVRDSRGVSPIGESQGYYDNLVSQSGRAARAGSGAGPG
jgi:hypothetical protein